MARFDFPGKVLALAGGIGGSKLALGLYRVLAPEQLTIIANTGDDFEHFGLPISPDLDTLMYTLAGVNNPETGWGRADETWTFMRALEQFGAETWFQLGDGDLATHVERARWLHAGASLTDVTAHLGTHLGVRARLLPMSDDPVRTRVYTDVGVLAFQEYFVREHCRPVVSRLEYSGSERARPNPAFLDALADPQLRAVLICPSNPFLSIDPILSLAGIEDALRRAGAPVIAVSPIVGGAALKGPTAKLMRELGMPVTAAAVARYYGALLDGLVLDRQDADEADELALPVVVTETVMNDLAARERLAREVLLFAAELYAHGA